MKKNLNLNKISILKIDVGGSELEVLKSFENEIINSAPIILIEILPVYKSENKVRFKRQNEIQQLFKYWGYSMHRIIKQKNSLTDIVHINDIGIHSDLDNCDYVVVPDTKLKEFKNHSQQISHTTQHE